MMVSRRAFTPLAAVVAASLAFGSPALAHRGHAGLSVVEIDPASGSVNVVHRFYAHDLEPNALRVLAPEAQPSLDDPAALAALETHLASRFRLDIDGVRLPLTHTGTRLAGDNVRIDFGGQSVPGPVHEVRVDLDLFSDVYDDMEMQVNVRVEGVTRTVLFRPGVQGQTLTFQP